MKLTLVVLLIGILAVSASERPAVAGVAPHDADLYRGEWFTCLSSKEKIEGSRVNDDYCDCKDGSDEPGTAACASVVILPDYSEERTQGFYCANKGHRAKFIPHSFVNDGVCDCCDGSDEQGNNEMACRHTCREQGMKEMEQVKKEIALHEQGSKIKQTMIAEAQNLKPSLLHQKKESAKKLEELRAQMEAAQAKEQATKELSDLATDIHDDDSEDWIREDEEVDDEDKAQRRNDAERISKREEFARTHGKTPEEAKTAYKDAKSEARAATNAFNNEEVQFKRLEVLLTTDFGAKDEFLSLHGKTFSTRAGGYPYELKPFESSHQGGTLLGEWKEWKKKYTQMSYTGGKRCWGAGDREALVTVACGLENEITDVDEPSTCSYTMTLLTPAACSAEHAQALRMNYLMDDDLLHSETQEDNKKAHSNGWFF